MAPSRSLSEAFEAFWAAYPSRPDNPKRAAFDVFVRRVREGAEPAHIVWAAGQYAAAVKAAKVDGPFIPHARTWISQRRYEDYEVVPASAVEAQPKPEHPLAWLKDHMTAGSWSSWIEPLAVVEDGGAIRVLAPTQFALDQVRHEYGYLLRARYGAKLILGLKPKEQI